MRAIRFRRFGQREQDGGSFSPFDGITEQPVAPGTGEGLYAPLHKPVERIHFFLYRRLPASQAFFRRTVLQRLLRVIDLIYQGQGPDLRDLLEIFRVFSPDADQKGRVKEPAPYMHKAP